jgi:hypothetical protein
MDNGPAVDDGDDIGRDRADERQQQQTHQNHDFH